MAEACYTTQATTKQHVLNGIGKLTLQTNENGQYKHDAILLLEKGVRRVLQSQFNPSNPGKGMEKLLDTGDNRLTLVMSTNAIMVGSVIKEAKLHAKARSTSTGKTVLPTITAQAESQEEADHLNVINQAVISAKEGAADTITKLVGSDITDAILRTPNGSNHKGSDDFRLFDVIQAAIDGADLPSTKDVLEQLLEVINHTFDFCKKISVNMELVQSNVAWMATYGIVIGAPQIALTLLANIKTKTKANYATNFARPCTSFVRSTRTITCTLQRHSKSF